MTVLLSARHLEWRSEERTVLGPLDLDVRRGECLAIVGPNGAGKTTLLRCLTGLLRPSRGELRYDGRSFASLSRRRARAAHRLRAADPARARAARASRRSCCWAAIPISRAFQIAPRESDFAAVDAALAVVGIEDLRRRPVDELSGGERQAVYIAAALAQESELLVLDEPTIHLDARHQRDLAVLLLRLKRRRGPHGRPRHPRPQSGLASGRPAAGPLRGARSSPSEARRRSCGPTCWNASSAARFEIVRGGERPVTVLDLGLDLGA